MLPLILINLVRSEDFSPQKLMRTKVLTTNLFFGHDINMSIDCGAFKLSVSRRGGKSKESNLLAFSASVLYPISHNSQCIWVGT